MTVNRVTVKNSLTVNAQIFLLFFGQSLTICQITYISKRRGHWDFWFCGFRYFFDRFFGFCVKRLQFFGYGVQCGLRIFCFLVSGFQFCKKNTSAFLVLVPNVVCGFSYFFFPIWTYLGSTLSLIERQWSRIAETSPKVIERNAWQTGCRGS